MTRQGRLIETSDDPLARDLLESALHDGPNEAAFHRVAGGLGVGGAVVAHAATAHAASAQAAKAAALSSAAKTAAATTSVSVVPIASSGLATLKWLAIGLGGGALFWTGVAVLTADDPPAAAPAPARAEVRPTAHTAPAPRVKALEPPTLQSAVPETNVRQRKLDRASEPSARTAHGGLAAELVQIDEARRALRRGDAALALTLVEGYERTRTIGALDREAAVLRVDALLAQGHRDRASLEARRYVQAYPEDPHAARLRTIAVSKPGGDQIAP
jgi:hypothetical protein